MTKYDHRRQEGETWERRCSKCRSWFPETPEYFGWQNAGWWNSWCRGCFRERARRTMRLRRADPVESVKVREAKARHRASPRGREQRNDRNSVDWAVRQDRLIGAPHEITADDWKNIREITGYCCVYCDQADCKLQLEHVIPVSAEDYPGTIVGNVIPACPQCNNSKGPRRLEDWRPDLVPKVQSVLAKIEANMSRPLNAVRIYAYGDPDNITIKVGRTSQKGTLRKQQHEKRGPAEVDMTLIFELWGLPADESALKNDLSAIATPIVGKTGKKKEWFSTTEETRDWLRYVRNLWFVATKEGEIYDLYYCENKEWLPRYTTNRRLIKPKLVEASLFDEDELPEPWSDLIVSEVMEGDFYTSPQLVPAITISLGSVIELDPASCKEANANLRAKHFYGIKEDGLQQDWKAESVYINAPFGQWRLWVPKILQEWRKGYIRDMIVMAPSRATTSQEFHPLIQSCDGIFWPRGRFAFKGPLAASPDEGHFLFYFGSEVNRFCEAFAQFGTCFPVQKAA